MKSEGFQSLNWQKLTLTDQCVRGLSRMHIVVVVWCELQLVQDY